MRKRAQLFIAVEKNTGINDEERWKDNPPEARGELEIVLQANRSFREAES